MLGDSMIERHMEIGDIKLLHPLTGGVLDLRPGQLQPVSIDLHLGDVGNGVRWKSWKDGEPTRWMLGHGRFALASTFEIVELSPRIAGLAVGKSSVARRALQVEAAGLVDPGFRGQLTLELFNFGPDIELIEGEKIVQICFHQVFGTVVRPYGHPNLGSRYQDQRGPTAAR